MASLSAQPIVLSPARRFEIEGDILTYPTQFRDGSSSAGLPLVDPAQANEFSAGSGFRIADVASGRGVLASPVRTTATPTATPTATGATTGATTGAMSSVVAIATISWLDEVRALGGGQRSLLATWNGHLALSMTAPTLL
jgi:hypothetical protein